MLDVTAVQGGKHAPIRDPRNLKLADFSHASRPSVPDECDWTKAAVPGQWGGMLNVKAHLNDCTVASAGHMIQTWTANTSNEITVSDPEILSAYKTISGYDGTEATDRGAACLKVLQHWKNTGIGDHKIRSYVELELKNDYQLKEAVYVFGGAYVGFDLPKSALQQAQRPKEFPRETWSVVSGFDGGTWQNHCVCIVAYNAEKCTFVSWGHLWTMTWDFYKKYCDEAYTALSQDWLDTTKHAPNHIDLEKLQSEVDRLKNHNEASSGNNN